MVKMRQRKIDIVRLFEMIEEGRTQAEMAKEFDCTKEAVSRKIKAAGWRNAKAVLELEPWARVPRNHDPAVTVMERRLDLMQEIKDVNAITWRMINYETRKMDAIDAAEASGDPTGDLEKPNRHLVVSLLASVIKQCDSQINVEKIYFDAADVRKFINTVLGCVERKSPETRDEIIAEIGRARALSRLDG